MIPERGRLDHAFSDVSHGVQAAPSMDSSNP